MAVFSFRTFSYLTFTALYQLSHLHPSFIILRLLVPRNRTAQTPFWLVNEAFATFKTTLLLTLSLSRSQDVIECWTITIFKSGKSSCAMASIAMLNNNKGWIFWRLCCIQQWVSVFQNCLDSRRYSPIISHWYPFDIPFYPHHIPQWFTIVLLNPYFADVSCLESKTSC